MFETGREREKFLCRLTRSEVAVMMSRHRRLETGGFFELLDHLGTPPL